MLQNSTGSARKARKVIHGLTKVACFSSCEAQPRTARAEGERRRKRLPWGGISPGKNSRIGEVSRATLRAGSAHARKKITTHSPTRLALPSGQDRRTRGKKNNDPFANAARVCAWRGRPSRLEAPLVAYSGLHPARSPFSSSLRYPSFSRVQSSLTAIASHLIQFSPTAIASHLTVHQLPAITTRGTPPAQRCQRKNKTARESFITTRGSQVRKPTWGSTPGWDHFLQAILAVARRGPGCNIGWEPGKGHILSDTLAQSCCAIAGFRLLE